MNVDDLPPAVAQNFHLHEMDWPEDPNQQHAMLDAPFRFGDCPMDCLQAVLNLARNAETILRAPQVPLLTDTTPVIAIGSGPSLESHLDALRALQGKAILIASLSAVGGLRVAGIEPHYAVPIERTEDIIDWMPDCGPSLTFSGAPFVAKPVMDRFARHAYMPDANSLCAWSSLPDDLHMHYGSSTGTAAISMACTLTKGPVYLVGHDLAYDAGVSHWSGAKSAPMLEDGTVLGNNGEHLRSTWMWRRYRAMISELARCHGMVINTNALAKRGAAIDATMAGQLPDPASLPDLVRPALVSNERRLSLWKSRARQLPRSAHTAMRVFDSATDLDQLDIARAVPGPNGLLLAYILGSIYVQLSYEIAPNLPGKKTAITKPIAIRWCKQATMNVLRESLGVFEEVAEHGASHGA
jgi:hypothetical protein